MLWQSLTASGYAGLRKENVLSALHELLQEIHAVDPQRVRPDDVKPYQAAVLANLSDEHGAATRIADAVRVGEQAIGL